LKWGVKMRRLPILGLPEEVPLLLFVEFSEESLGRLKFKAPEPFNCSLLLSMVINGVLFVGIFRISSGKVYMPLFWGQQKKCVCFSGQ